MCVYVSLTLTLRANVEKKTTKPNEREMVCLVISDGRQRGFFDRDFANTKTCNYMLCATSKMNKVKRRWKKKIN